MQPVFYIIYCLADLRYSVQFQCLTVTSVDPNCNMQSLFLFVCFGEIDSKVNALILWSIQFVFVPLLFSFHQSADLFLAIVADILLKLTVNAQTERVSVKPALWPVLCFTLICSDDVWTPSKYLVWITLACSCTYIVLVHKHSQAKARVFILSGFDQWLSHCEDDVLHVHMHTVHTKCYTPWNTHPLMSF